MSRERSRGGWRGQREMERAAVRVDTEDQDGTEW